MIPRLITSGDLLGYRGKVRLGWKIKLVKRDLKKENTVQDNERKSLSDALTLLQYERLCLAELKVT